ncbi:MAG: ROK family protein [Ignavibacteria bacterium]
MRKPTKNQYVVSNQQVVKSINKTAILSIIRDYKSISRVSLSQITKLSQSTISSIVNELIEEGYIREISPENSSGGRRPTLLKVTMTNRILGAISLHSRVTKIAILDFEGNVLQKSSVKNSFTNPEDYLYACANEFNQLRSKFEGYKLLAVGVTVPGPVNPERGISLRCTSLGWKNMDIKYHISQFIDAKIIVENEANAFAYAENLYKINAVKDTSYAYFSVNDDVGTGVVFNDKVLTLNNSSGFEFAHTSIDQDGELCGCGNNGCLETFISNKALIEIYNDLYYDHKEKLPETEATGSIYSFKAEQVNEMVQLRWDNNVSDIWYFNIYSSADPNFEINRENLIGSSAIGSYLFHSAKPEETRYYQVSIVDHQKKEKLFSPRISFTVNKMEKIFFDDFAANTIDNYKLEGNVNVQWQEGRLILGDNLNDQNDMIIYHGDYGNCIISAKVKPTAAGIWDTIGILAKVHDSENWYCGLIAYGVLLKEQHSLAFMRRKFASKRGEHWIVFYPFSVEVGKEYIIKMNVHKEILQLKAWPFGENEPEHWQLSITDDTGWETGGIGIRHFGLGAEVSSLSVKDAIAPAAASRIIIGNTLSDFENQAKMIIAKALDGNEIAVKAIKRIGKYIGVGISNIVNVLGIKTIVVPCNFIQAWHIIKPEIDKELNKRIIVFDAGDLKILPLEINESLLFVAAASLGAKEVFSGVNGNIVEKESRFERPEILSIPQEKL